MHKTFTGNMSQIDEQITRWLAEINKRQPRSDAIHVVGGATALAVLEIRASDPMRYDHLVTLFVWTTLEGI